MAIGGVGSYSNYTNSYVKNNNINKSEKAEEVEETSMTSEDFLKELKKEFPDVNIYTAKITKNNEQNFVGGTGLYNIAVSDEYFEKMASEPQKRAEFKQSVQEIKDATNMKVAWGKSDNIDVHASGFIIDEDGGMSSWSAMKTLDPSKNTLENWNQKQGLGQSTLLKGLDTNQEKRRAEQKELEEKRLEKRETERREVERKEEKEADETRLQKELEEKRLETRRLREKEIEDLYSEIFKGKKVEHTFIYDDEPKVKNNFVSAFNSPSIKFKNNSDLVGNYQSDLNVGIEQGFNKEI